MTSAVGRIVSIEFKPYHLRLAVPYRWSKGVQHYRDGLIARAEFGGEVGWGEVALPPHVVMPLAAHVALARATVAGLDPASESFLDDLELRECSPRLRCGIATAVLDVRARLRRVSLASLCAGWDGVAKRVPVNDLIGDADPDTCAERARDAVARGQDTIKVKCTPERTLDLARVRAIRDAAPQAGLRLDPNESWSPAWAAEHLEAMARFGIAYCEEPLPRGTPLPAYAELRQKTSVPIALDDSARSRYHVERIIELGAADALVLKAPRVGGPDRMAEIVRVAESAGLNCTVTASLETSVGLYAALHCAAFTSEPIPAAGIGTARYFAENVGPPPEIVDGEMELPRGPGLGFAPDEWWARA